MYFSAPPPRHEVGPGGGGVQGGQVLGATDQVGGYCKTRTWSPADAVATVYKAVGVDPHITLPA